MLLKIRDINIRRIPIPAVEKHSLNVIHDVFFTTVNFYLCKGSYSIPISELEFCLDGSFCLTDKATVLLH